MTISSSPVERVGRVDKKEFLDRFKKTARPVVLEEMMQGWPARDKWSMDYFISVAGDIPVPLYDSQPSRDYKHQHAAATTMSLREYLGLLESGENDLRLFFFNLLTKMPVLAQDFEFPDIGLKLFRKLPVLFMGGKGAKVQMHFDIDLADILLCHFGGRKRVLLIPPEQTKYMYHVPFSFSNLFDVDFDNPDYEKYPALRHLRAETAVLNHGDILYIPPGYWHYIVYEDIGFSMALRAFPREPAAALKMLRNLALIRTVEGLMRGVIGQSWNDRNERLAVTRTHKRIGIA